MLSSFRVVLVAAVALALNIQPRIDGAQQAIKDSGKSIKFTAIGTNADITKGLSIIDAYAQGHPNLDYTIDQQPYLQGFLPVLYLYLYKLSGGLLFPSETNTGLLFVTKDNVAPYQMTKTRFQGSDTTQKVVERSGAIPHA